MRIIRVWGLECRYWKATVSINERDQELDAFPLLRPNLTKPLCRVFIYTQGTAGERNHRKDQKEQGRSGGNLQGSNQKKANYLLLAVVAVPADLATLETGIQFFDVCPGNILQ
jgi:hypothetical protein